MAAAQRAIPAHLRDGVAPNGEATASKRNNHHQKSQSHMVSLEAMRKVAMHHTDRTVHGSSGRLWMFILGRCEHSVGQLLLVTPGACNDVAPNINNTFTSIITLLMHASIPAQQYQSINSPCINQFTPGFLLGTAPFSTYSASTLSLYGHTHFHLHSYLSLSLVSPSVSLDSRTSRCSAHNHQGSCIYYGTGFCMFTANEASCRLKGLRKCLHRYCRQSNAKCPPRTTRDMQRREREGTIRD